jgi:hypothetical protein
MGYLPTSLPTYGLFNYLPMGVYLLTYGLHTYLSITIYLRAIKSPNGDLLKVILKGYLENYIRLT